MPNAPQPQDSFAYQKEKHCKSLPGLSFVEGQSQSPDSIIRKRCLYISGYGERIWPANTFFYLTHELCGGLECEGKKNEIVIG